MGRREHLALVGAGGKTSLLFGLARELSRKGGRVLVTCTTKMRYSEARMARRVLFTREDASWRTRLEESLRETGPVFLAETLLETGKVQGISPLLAEELYASGIADYLLVEADGAAGHPLKAPADHEPVIPGGVSAVIALMGLEALGRPFSPETVFRAARFRDITGCEPDRPLTPRILARVVNHPFGLFKGAAASARKIVFLNKVDLLRREEKAEELGRLILRESGGTLSRVVVGSLRAGRYYVIEE
ncbi:MAG: putative selenium-dependent hydroxylase accessory protein YqeC [Deltaproteobacteria bacterium]|nr:putative selenium-dependent hydroxylase accessory protein YqeC [Deltaproteobacteria bacterium]MBW2017489.1 putative selenium-dependent hydroxylase accessory protein YqeC [Deltaproteobacteria bacterium]MBW2304641.1 putative selenium-dependent hydroxylase accessory protein YqeC [Deltaproteobacteria bacterium]